MHLGEGGGESVKVFSPIREENGMKRRKTVGTWRQREARRKRLKPSFPWEGQGVMGGTNLVEIVSTDSLLE